jgi:hypothetical protein
MKIGKAHRNVRSANRRCETVHDIEKSEGLPLSNTSSVGVQGGSVRQYIGASMSPSANRQWGPGTVRH